MSALDRAWPLARAGLFAMDAETAHHLTLRALGAAPRAWAALLGPLARAPRAPVEVAGVRFAGPVGLAAGLDKDGVAIPVWAALGFGGVEVGTVTAHPQPGNPRPRLHRLPAQAALINRMGFNNAGSEALAHRLRALRERGWPAVPVGVNLGKSKITPLEAATGDYVRSVQRLRGLPDWFTVNISSPNTPGLRALQTADALDGLLPAVLEAAHPTPVFLKLAPDLDPEALAATVQRAVQLGVHALIATNTTVSRDGVHAPGLDGGLSGRPLWPLARQRIAQVLQAAGPTPVIGVGGIERADQVRQLLDLGCRAVQLYTAFVYQGPGLPSRLHRELP